MIELPEAINLAKQLQTLSGRTVAAVRPAAKEHKFCWYSCDPALYDSKLRGSSLTEAEGFGIFVELNFGNGCKLCVNDGVNMRFTDKPPKNYQLLIEFTDGTALCFTVAMYGGIVLHDGSYDNEYYLSSLHSTPPQSDGFADRFRKKLAESRPNLSAKAFLATEQRFPGIGNGVLQDILFDARIYPKRKISTLTEAEKAKLLESVVSVTSDMIAHGGRDTEKGIYGEPGGYMTKMSKLSGVCPVCGSSIVKETYLGGSVYYCPECQRLEK